MRDWEGDKKTRCDVVGRDLRESAVGPSVGFSFIPVSLIITALELLLFPKRLHTHTHRVTRSWMVDDAISHPTQIHARRRRHSRHRRVFIISFFFYFISCARVCVCTVRSFEGFGSMRHRDVSARDEWKYSRSQETKSASRRRGKKRRQAMLFYREVYNRWMLK